MRAQVKDPPMRERMDRDRAHSEALVVAHVFADALERANSCACLSGDAFLGSDSCACLSEDAFTAAELVKRLAQQEETYFDHSISSPNNQNLSSDSVSPRSSSPQSGFEPATLPRTRCLGCWSFGNFQISWERAA